jgi:transposase
MVTKPPGGDAHADKAEAKKHRLNVINAASLGLMRQDDAAKALCITERQVRRLIKAYMEEGPEGLLRKGSDNIPHNATAPEIIDRVLELYRTTYYDFGPQLLSEVLEDDHGITLSRETLRRILIKAGLWKRKVRKPVHRRRRERRACVGDLVQMDTSIHKWLGEDGPVCSLITIIDDASSKIYTKLYPADSTLTNMDLTTSTSMAFL